jgi:hypothetical protein
VSIGNPVEGRIPTELWEDVMTKPEELLLAESQDEARALARKRVEARRDFATHAVAFAVVNAFLVGVWALSGGGYFWPAWVIAGWGIGLALNAWDVYGRRPITEADIDDELRRLEQ